MKIRHLFFLAFVAKSRADEELDQLIANLEHQLKRAPRSQGGHMNTHESRRQTESLDEIPDSPEGEFYSKLHYAVCMYLWNQIFLAKLHYLATDLRKFLEIYSENHENLLNSYDEKHEELKVFYI